jgi:hypothetical protein
MPEIKVSLSDEIVIRKYNIDTKEDGLLSVSDIKAGDYATIYVDKTATSPFMYKALGVKVFSRDFISK